MMDRSRSNTDIIGLLQRRLDALEAKQGFRPTTYDTFETWHKIGNVGEPMFQNSWANYNSSQQEFAAYWKNAAGMVELRGVIKAGAIGAIFTLPPRYRPLGVRRFHVVANSAFGQVDVLTTGDVMFRTGSNVWVSLDTISFRAEQ